MPLTDVVSMCMLSFWHGDHSVFSASHAAACNMSIIATSTIDYGMHGP